MYEFYCTHRPVIVNPYRQTASMSRADVPLAQELRALMDEHGLTFRSLAEATKPHDPRGRGLSHSYLGALARDEEVPSTWALEIIAATLEVPACTFVEYRLAAVKRAFDRDAVGFDQARAALAELEAWVRARTPGSSELADALRSTLACEDDH